MTATRTLVIDVDGVLNVDPPAWPGITLITHTPPSDGPHPPIRVHPDLPAWLSTLASHSDRIIWNTSWTDMASSWVGPALGLPADLEYINHPRTSHIGFGRSSKISPLYTRLDGNTRVAILDDLVGGKDWASAEDRGWYIPTLDGRGLTTGIVTAVTNYLDTGILPAAPDDDLPGSTLPYYVPES